MQNKNKMVRKRSRTSRKNYESDDNDSDSDFSLEDPRSQPAPKKYSLRQRKKALFIDDYDYEDDDEILPIPPTQAHSDDEDFEVENELELDEGANSDYIDNNQYEDPTEDPNGLIDFEDMIRADIVVNKNRIDYDNMIDKTEIKIQPNKEPPPPTPFRTKRGRKPKPIPENEDASSVLEPETEVQEDQSKGDGDYHPEENIESPPQNCVPDSVEQQSSVEKTIQDESVDEEKVNFESKNEKQPLDTEDAQELLQTEVELLSDDPEVTNTNDIHSNSQESVIKFNESYIHKTTHLNGDILSTETQEFPKSKGSVGTPLKTEDEDDDVVFVEDRRSEIIVLDD